MNIKENFLTILLSFGFSTFLLEFYQKFEPLINILVVSIITLGTQYIKNLIQKYK